MAKWLPTDIDDAREYVEVMSQCFKELDNERIN